MSPEERNKVLKEIDWRIRVFDSLSFPTLILKPDKTIVSANQILLEKFGLNLEEIEGRPCHELIFGSEDPCPSANCPVTRVLADREGHSVLIRSFDENGVEGWEDRVFSPIVDDHGDIAYIIESFRDVTKMKVLEKTLKETETLLEKVVQSSPSAILAADCRGELLFANEAAEHLFGYRVREAVKVVTAEGLYPPGVAKEIMKKMRDESIGGKGKLPSTQITIVNDKGEVIPVEMTASIIYEDGEEVATMGIYNDLREKLAVEDQLRRARHQLVQTEKMASLGQLAAGVAHEINNPLTGILFYANLALESLEDDNPLREDLGYVIEDVHRCKDIVKNLLAYSRQQGTSKTLIQLNELVEQSLNLIRDQKTFAHVKIEREMSGEMMMINVDKNQFHQVIINLIMNAIAAMDGRGELTFRTYRDKQQGKVFLEIQDTGCGILQENLSKIFDPFFTTKELGKGTGLGLSTVYGLVHENGGNVRVKQTSPAGTTFQLEMPLFKPSDGDPNEAGMVQGDFSE